MALKAQPPALLSVSGRWCGSSAPGSLSALPAIGSSSSEGSSSSGIRSRTAGGGASSCLPVACLLSLRGAMFVVFLALLAMVISKARRMPLDNSHACARRPSEVRKRSLKRGLAFDERY